jgi:hypothetical protein
MIKLDTYDKTKQWLSQNVHRTFFPSDNNKFMVLKTLLDRHPSKSEWKNPIPRSFKITRSPANKALLLYVKFEGITRYRIVSWKACASGKLEKCQKGPENQLNGAMRHAVRVQINKYKKSHPHKICVLCKSTTRIEVDHYPMHFVEIKNAFLKSRKDPPPTDFKWHPKRGNFMFKDGTKEDNYYGKRWKQAWQRYHNKHATYRYLCSTCNKKTNKCK